MALQRGAGAEGNDRDFMARAQLHHFLHLFGGVGEHHRVGQGRRMIAFALAMLLAYRMAGGQAVAKTLPQTLIAWARSGAKVSAVAIIVLSLRSTPLTYAAARPGTSILAAAVGAPRAKAGLGHSPDHGKTTPGEIMATGKPNVEDTRVSVWGKIIGGAAGFAFGGPLGALLGAVAGHAVDRYRAREVDGDDEGGTRKIAFTIGVIALGAKMAKADGVVTRDEIAAFREVFHVPEEEVRNVARVWDLARQSSDGFEIYAKQIADLFAPQAPVLEQLLGSLFHIARADGQVHEAERAYLREVAAIFGFDETAFQRLSAMWGDVDADDPYAILGVKPTASDADIKSAHRAWIRSHHPDRLIAEGLPEELIEAATAKLADVNAAYDRIKALRGQT